MKGPSQKSKFALWVFCSISLLTFILIAPQEKPLHRKKITKSTSTPISQDTTDHNIKSTRAPASIKKAAPRIKPKTITKGEKEKRIILGKYNPEHEITLSNKLSKDWLKKYQANFIRMTGANKLKNLEVTQKRSVLKVKNNIGRHLEHVVVRYQTPGGLPFSFEAYIDSQTGQMIQSWNQTHIEFKKEAKIEATHNRYRKN